MQGLTATEDLVCTINDQLDHIVHANVKAIKAVCFLDLSSKQPLQAEDFVALQSKAIKKQSDSTAVR